jgi:hypothetical protein
MDPGDILPTILRAAPEVAIFWCFHSIHSSLEEV